MTIPDLTAILPTTAKRAPFIPLAFDRLRAQLSKLPGKTRIEIIVVSEDQRAIATSLAAAYPATNLDVITVAHAPKLTLAAKRNLACTHARAPWITFLDDDDWSRSDRFAATLEAISHLSKPLLVGSSTMLVHELVTSARKTSAYRYTRTDSTYPAWHFVGGTLTFQRDLWREMPFDANDTEGAEAYWQMRLDPDTPRREISDDPELYVAFLHGGNISTRQITVPQGPSYTPRSGSFYLENVVGEGDAERGSMLLARYVTAAAITSAMTEVRGVER